jgi:lipid-A-disaccharide synthase
MTTPASGPQSAMPLDRVSGEREIFLVAAEESGDRLGGALMRALRQRSSTPLRFAGVGGREMTAAGLVSLLPMEDFAIIGFSAIPARLPRIVSYMAQIVRAVLARRPHALVIIDSPAFTLRIARFVRWFDRSIPIIDYVSPSVWAWRAGRARAMRGYVDHVLALLPFEPEAHRRLGGPPCSYVGHPLIEEAAMLRPDGAETARRLADPPIVLAMPGSRSSEVARLGGIFGEALALVAERVGPIEVVVPTVPHLVAQVTEATSRWRIQRRILVGRSEKLAAMRVARAALAKSGTTTLELAVAGVPMVAAYKVAPLEAAVIRRLVRVPSYILANLVIGESIVPEIVQEDCTPQQLSDALVPLLADSPARRRQVEAFARLDAIMEIGSRAPAARAADIVLQYLRRGSGAGKDYFRREIGT